MELIGTLAAVALIIILNHRGIKLYWAISAGIIVLVVTNRFAVEEIISIGYSSLTSDTMITLTLIVITLTAFGNLLKETGGLNNIMTTLSALIKNLRYQMVILPLLIGLITFPGGAIFSAPLVEEAGKKMDLSGARMALANVTFRHLQYLVYPLYPGLLIVAELSGYSLYRFIQFNLPVLVLFFFAIYFYVFKGLDTGEGVYRGEKKKVQAKELFALFYSLGPLLIIIILAVAFGFFFPLAITIGIVAAFASYFPKEGPFGEIIKARLGYLAKGINWSMTFSIIAILIFKEFLEHSEVINEIMAYMLGNGLPMLALVIVIPFLAGFIIGNPYASIGISVPLFMPILPDSEQGFYYMALVFICALAGYFGSPLHMCTILTAEHFRTSLPVLLKDVNILSAALIILGVAIYLFWQYII